MASACVILSLGLWSWISDPGLGACPLGVVLDFLRVRKASLLLCRRFLETHGGSGKLLLIPQTSSSAGGFLLLFKELGLCVGVLVRRCRRRSPPPTACVPGFWSAAVAVARRRRLQPVRWGSSSSAAVAAARRRRLQPVRRFFLFGVHAAGIISFLT